MLITPPPERRRFCESEIVADLVSVINLPQLKHRYVVKMNESKKQYADPVRAQMIAQAGHKELIDAAELIADGKVAKAEAILRPFLKTNPLNVNAIRLLAEIGLELGALKDAENLLIRCLELAPDYHAARYSYTNVLYKRHRFKDAIAMLDELLEIEPDNGVWLTMKAANLVEINEHQQAMEIFEYIIEKFPSNPQVYMSYGHALRAVGRAEESIAAYKKCIEQGTGLGEAFWSLANLKTYKFSEGKIAQMEAILRDKSCDYRDYYHLLFALGKAREDRKEHQLAMAAYAKGNQVRGKSVPWSVERFHQDTQKIKSLFSEDFFREKQSMGCLANDPIFIVGLPRAGSTLIEQILSSHSQVEGTAELADIIALARKIDGKIHRDDPGLYPGALAQMTTEQFTEMGQAYLDSTAVQRVANTPRFIDKMPNNFSHVGLINLILPNAKIIDARRNPMDCCFSGYKQLFASGQGFTYGQERIGRYYRDYVDLMDHWDRVLPGRVLRVSYEAMVEDTENQVRRLLEYCQLPFEEQCLNFYENKRTIRTASSEQVRQPIYRSGMNQWQPFEQWLAPLQEALEPILEHDPIVR
jgi:tetratricopeptide (TPR) repeat protein